MSYKSQRSRSVPSVWESGDYQIIFAECWRCFNGPQIRSEQFFPEKTDWFSRIWQQFRGLAHFRHCCHNLNCSNVADTSARRDPNQGDVRNGRDLYCSEAGVGGFSPLLPCLLLISDFVLVLAYGNGGLQFLFYFHITVKFLWFVGVLMQLSIIPIYCLSHTLP